MDSNHYYVLTLISCSFLIIFIANVVFAELIPDHLKPIMYTLLSSSLFISLMIISYIRLKQKLNEDIVLINTDSQDSQIDITNPITIALSFMSYYISLYIHTIILTILLFLATYVIYILLSTLCTNAIDTEFKKSLFYIPWFLYGWIEILCLLLIGGKLKKDSDYVFNWISYLKNSLKLVDIFKLISITYISRHYLPFIIGLILSTAICIYMSFWNFLTTKEEQEKFKNNFKQGFLIVSVVVICIYIISTGRLVYDEYLSNIKTSFQTPDTYIVPE